MPADEAGGPNAIRSVHGAPEVVGSPAVFVQPSKQPEGLGLPGAEESTGGCHPEGGSCHDEPNLLGRCLHADSLTAAASALGGQYDPGMLPICLLCAMLMQAAPSAQGQAPDVPAAGKGRPEEKWTVDYKPGPFRMYRSADGTLYWYATFTLVNRTGKDRRLAPRWELLDEQGRISAAGQGVDSDVTRAILKMLNDPSLEEVSSILGEISQGEEAAKTGVVVFPAGPESRRLSLMVSGLSTERSTIRDPKTGQPVLLRKTLRIDYQVPGERGKVQGELPLAEAETGQVNPGWIMR